jgi:cytidylate kinase
MKENELLHQLKENLHNTETLRTEYYPIALMIYGRPGTGQSAIAEELSKRSGIKLYRAGGIKRDEIRSQTGQEIIGKLNLSEDEDRRIDQEIKREIKEATASGKVIIDAKLSNVIFREMIRDAKKTGQRRPKGIGVLIVAQTETRMKRIRLREIKKYVKTTGIPFEQAEKDPQFSLQTIHKKTMERERGDLERWRKIHPQLANIDPFNTVNKDNFGNKIFDFHINTTELTVERGADIIEAVLLTKYKNDLKKTHGA